MSRSIPRDIDGVVLYVIMRAEGKSPNVLKIGNKVVGYIL